MCCFSPERSGMEIFMASGIYTEIKKRIEAAEPGTVFLISDFTDIATTTTVRKCLGGQVAKLQIKNGTAVTVPHIFMEEKVSPDWS